MPRMRISAAPASLDDGLAGKPRSIAVEQRRVLRAVDLVRPHHERVLVGLRVVALAHADRAEPEPPVQLLRAALFDIRTSSVRLVAPRSIASRASTSSRRVPIWWRCHAGSTAIVVTWPSSTRHHQPRVADDVATDLATKYARVRAQAELGQEQRHASTGRGYTWFSMCSTERRCRRRIGTMCTVERLGYGATARHYRPRRGPTRSRRRSGEGTADGRSPAG